MNIDDPIADFTRRADILRDEVRKCHRKVTAANRYYCAKMDNRRIAQHEGAGNAELADHYRMIARAKANLNTAQAAWFEAQKRYEAA